MDRHGHNLLVVDDQAGVRRLLFEALVDEGMHVELAASGPEALQKIKKNAVDLVLLDMRMPGMSGLDVLRELRKLNPDLPVIMMTAYGELDLVAEAKRQGVRHYLNKPFDLQEVRYLVKALLPEKQSAGLYMEEIG
ncbi:response regulator [Desulfofundulus thermobenzoicus]|uniref:Stage 0 sporulation protein A homolog n=1 Tax=Desulfofundulus thermobenzoicus TaxID=29376 RepID=A0A6N7IUH4_9FIRM|nr:response regulator [Desulfofundulus thermobenzoicus]MQL53097.1 response regulator [Desulfofundulus thermobenzoicus]